MMEIGTHQLFLNLKMSSVSFEVQSYPTSPFFVSLSSAIYLLALPVFLLWRMKKRDRDFPISTNEKKVTYLLTIAITAMAVSEILKIAFFGLEMYQGYGAK